MSQVRLFDFLGLQPGIHWDQAPVETAQLPAPKNLVVVHTASYGSPRDFMREPVPTFRSNTEGLVHLFNQAQGRGVVHVVYFSSAEIYGQPPDAAIPTPESYHGSLDPLSPRSIYGESKRMAEVLGTCLSQRTGIPFTVLRPWNLYGPGQKRDDGRVPVEFVRQAREQGSIRLTSDGSPRRAFCYVWDGIRQITNALPPARAVKALNVGNPSEEMTILELARACAGTCGLPASCVSYDPAARAPGLQRCAPDVSLSLRRLAGKPDFVPLSRGLRSLVEWLDFISRYDCRSMGS